MPASFIRGHSAGVDGLLCPCVVYGKLIGFAVTDQIDATVSHMRQVEVAIYHSHHGAGGSHARQFGVSLCLMKNLSMSSSYCLLQCVGEVIFFSQVVLQEMLNNLNRSPARLPPACVAPNSICDHSNHSRFAGWSCQANLECRKGVFVPRSFFSRMCITGKMKCNR